MFESSTVFDTVSTPRNRPYTERKGVFEFVTSGHAQQGAVFRPQCHRLGRILLPRRLGEGNAEGGCL
jgi:hypothetical protein